MVLNNEPLFNQVDKPCSCAGNVWNFIPGAEPNKVFMYICGQKQSVCYSNSFPFLFTWWKIRWCFLTNSHLEKHPKKFHWNNMNPPQKEKITLFMFMICSVAAPPTGLWWFKYSPNVTLCFIKTRFKCLSSWFNQKAAAASFCLHIMVGFCWWKKLDCLFPDLIHVVSDISEHLANIMSLSVKYFSVLSTSDFVCR